MFPTLAVCVEAFMMDDPDQLYANFRSFNTWLDEEWGFDHQGRVYAPPLLSLRDLDRAVIELDWVLARGAQAICLRAGPAYGRSPADPYFDPFWARVNEAGLTVAFHIGESSYNELFSAHWGEEPNPPSHRQSAFQWTCFYGDRPIMDTIAALIYHNLFGRFPNVRVMSIENGSLWVPYLMRVDGQDERHGPQRTVARGPHHREAERDLQTSRVRLAVSRRADRRARVADRRVTGAVRFGLPARRRARRPDVVRGEHAHTCPTTTCAG